MAELLVAGKNISGVEAVLFDKDGTLIDSHIYWGAIVEKRSKALIERLGLGLQHHEPLCKAMGFSLQSRKLLPKGPVGIATREKVIKAVHKYLVKAGAGTTENEIAKIFADVHSLFLNEIHSHLRVLPGVEGLLMELKKKGVKTALITTDSVKNASESMQFLGLAKYFHALIGRESTPQPKHTGVPALIALSSLGVKPGNAVCIGDALMDIEMGKKAGLKAEIGVALGQTKAEALFKETRYVINDYGQLSVL